MIINVFWCHITHLNPLKKDPERIINTDKRMINDLGYVDIKFHVSKKDYCKIEQKNSICINVSCYGNDLVYSVHVSDEKFKDCMDLLLMTVEKSSIISISKILTDLCVIRLLQLIKIWFLLTACNL